MTKNMVDKTTTPCDISVECTSAIRRCAIVNDHIHETNASLSRWNAPLVTSWYLLLIISQPSLSPCSHRQSDTIDRSIQRQVAQAPFVGDRFRWSNWPTKSLLYLMLANQVGCLVQFTSRVFIVTSQSYHWPHVALRMDNRSHEKRRCNGSRQYQDSTDT